MQINQRINEAKINQTFLLKLLDTSIDELKEDLTPENKRKISDLKDTNSVLNKRQLAFKVSANSMYGALGTKTGYLPLPPAAMCVTHTGKYSILKANEFFLGTLVHLY